MKATVFVSIAVIALTVCLPVPSNAEFQNAHSQFACTTCHAKTPVAGDTLETAPLVKPRPELCLFCHGDTHGD